jgi:hypothetical protein
VLPAIPLLSTCRPLAKTKVSVAAMAVHRGIRKLRRSSWLPHPNRSRKGACTRLRCVSTQAARRKSDIRQNLAGRLVAFGTCSTIRRTSTLHPVRLSLVAKYRRPEALTSALLRIWFRLFLFQSRARSLPVSLRRPQDRTNLTATRRVRQAVSARILAPRLSAVP